MSKIKIDCVIGIDPGKSGGLAIWKAGQATVQIKMPADLMELKRFFMDKMEICNLIVFLEKVSMRPDDLQGGKAFGIAKMLADFNTLKNILTFLEIPFVLVNPTKWQNGLNLRAKGEEKKDRKKRYQRFAQDNYKELKVTLWSADALCIMSFGRYMLNSDRGQQWVLSLIPEYMHNRLFE